MQVSWQSLYNDLRDCQKCGLCKGRKTVVIGEGNPQASLMLIGEGPGLQEDLQGRPFVGPAGQLLDKMLAAIELEREDVYIANVVKCRPPGNRNPEPDEVEACLPHLRAQVALVRPSVILLLGAVALRATISPSASITRMRGSWIERGNVSMMPTYHPAALLRDASKKRAVWLDLQAVQARLQSLYNQ